MTKTHQKGFILMFVMLLLTLVGLALILLSNCTRIMAFDSSTAKLHADAENIIKSCTAWIDVNTKKIKKHPKNKTIELDLTNLQIPTALCSITVTDTNKSGTNLEINYTCTKGRRKIQKKQNYTLK